MKSYQKTFWKTLQNPRKSPQKTFEKSLKNIFAIPSIPQFFVALALKSPPQWEGTYLVKIDMYTK